MRRAGFVVVFAVGCSSNHGPPLQQDGAVPDGAVIDASPDAPSCNGPDRDHDGICDDVDDCPDVFDPGQPDLDHDGIGWVCDSVESTSIDIGSNTFNGAGGGLHDTTFAGSFAFDCTQMPTGLACSSALLAVSPYGVVSGRTDSSQPQDAWLAGMRVNLGITADDNILATRTGSAATDTGTWSIPGGIYTPLIAQIAQYDTSENATVLLGMLAPGSQIPGQYDLLAAPSGGQLVTLATPQTYLRVNPSFSGPQLSQFFGIVTPTVNGSTTTYSLRTFTAGATALADVMIAGTPATDLDQVNGIGQPSAPDYVGIPYYALRGTQAYVGNVSPIGSWFIPLPFSSSQYIPGGLESSPTSSSTLFVEGQPGPNMWTVIGVRNGQAFDVLVNEPVTAPNVHIYGDQVPIIALDPGNSSTPWKVVAITSNNTIVPISTNLIDVTISVEGDVAQITGVPMGSTAPANLVLVRYRMSTGTLDQATIQTNVPVVPAPLTTTTEGAAIIIATNANLVVPSGSMTPMGAGFSSIDDVWARGSGTVVLAVPTGGTPGLYAYDEVGGQPRFTQLIPPTNGLGVFPLDPQTGPPTQWFDYGTGTNCTIAKLATVNGAPALANQIPCQYSFNVHPIGLTGDGSLVESDVSLSTPNVANYYLLGATTGALIAQFASSGTGAGPRMITDLSVPGSPIVGWVGTDMLGPVACLASHPDWCWALPPAPFYGLEGNAGPPDGSIMVEAGTTSGTTATLTIIRSLDHGNRPQPLM